MLIVSAPDTADFPGVTERPASPLIAGSSSEQANTTSDRDNKTNCILLTMIPPISMQHT